MFKVKVIAVGRCKEAWLNEAIAEYKKRLQGKMEIEWVIVESLKELSSAALAEKGIIALDVEGKLLDSAEASRRLYGDWGSRPVFVIGGAEGLPQEIRERACLRWSLSPLTFTNQMVRLILVEQLYRATEIERGSAYHK